MADFEGLPGAVFLQFDGKSIEGNGSNLSIDKIEGLEISIDSEHCKFDAIFEENDDPAHIFETVLLGQQNDGSYTNKGQSVLRGYAENLIPGCILVMGTHPTKKSQLFQGLQESNRQDDGGMIVASATLLFQLLETKEKILDSPYLKMDIFVSFAEIYDEIATDLFHSKKNNLKVCFDPTSGYVVDGISKVKVNNVEDVENMLKLGKSKRNVKVYPNGGSATLSSSTVFRFSLTHTEGQSPSDAMMKTVDLLIVECPSLGKLGIGLDQVVAREGPGLSKALFALQRVVGTLSRAHEEAHLAPPFAQSNFTKLLQEYLGGNAILASLVSIGDCDKATAKAALRLANQLGEVWQYPVDGGFVLPGLQHMYRKWLWTLMNAHNVLDAQQGRMSYDELLAEKRVREIQDELLQVQLERNEAKEDGSKVYKMLELFKAKYSKLVEEKAAQYKDLVEAEEAKLEVTKALLELKLQLSQEKEKYETEKYHTTSELLRTKNELCDAEIKLQQSEKKCLDANEEIKRLEQKAVDIKKEGSEDHIKVKNLMETLESEQAHNTEISAELLTLVNQNDALRSKNEDFEESLAQAKLESSEAQSLCKQLQSKVEELESSVQAKEREIENFKSQILRLQLELERASLATEAEKVQLGGKLQQELFKKQEEIIKDELALNQEHAQVEILQQELHNYQKQIRAMEMDLHDRIEELKVLKEENSSKNKHIQVMRNRNNLEDAFENLVQSAGAGAGVNLASLQKKLFDNFKLNEANLVSECEMWRNKYRTVVQSNQAIQKRFLDIYEKLKRIDPGSLTEHDTIFQELEMSSNQISSDLEAEIVSLRENLQQSKAHAQDCQQNAIVSVGKMQDKIKELGRCHQHEPEQTGNPSQHNHIQVDGKEKEEQIQHRIQEVQNLILSKISEVKEMFEASAISNSLKNETKNPILVREASVTMTSSEFHNLKGENQQHVIQVKALREEVQVLKEAKSSLHAKIKEFEHMFDKKVGGSQHSHSREDVERRCAALLSKNAMLEEELQNYQNYMKKTVQKYKVQINSLNTEIDRLKTLANR